MKTVAIAAGQLMSFAQDITELKQIEASLRTNQERFELAEQMGKVGNWEYDFTRETFWGSKEARRIYGFPR